MVQVWLVNPRGENTMINPTQSINTFPVVAVATSLTPADFQDMPYSSALLLPVCFDASITSHADYAPAVCDGFDEYFEDMWNVSGTDLVFVDRFYSWDEVRREIVEGVVPRNDLREQFYGLPSLAWRVGFAVGWLSALALTDRALALRGLDWLVQWVNHLSPTVAGGSSASAFCSARDSAGWPLDL
jgi:hypothetical protein